MTLLSMMTSSWQRRVRVISSFIFCIGNSYKTLHTLGGCFCVHVSTMNSVYLELVLKLLLWTPFLCPCDPSNFFSNPIVLWLLPWFVCGALPTLQMTQMMLGHLQRAFLLLWVSVFALVALDLVRSLVQEYFLWASKFPAQSWKVVIAH